MSIEKYIEACNKQDIATSDGDYKSANEQYDIIVGCVKSLKENDELSLLLPLLENESDSVKLWTASFLIFHHESQSLAVIKEIAKKDGILSFDADMILQEWRSGNMKEII